VQVVSLRPLPQDWVDTAWSHYDAASRAAWLAMYRSYPTLTSADEMGRAEAAALRPYHIPALVIWGETDPFLPVYVAFEQQDAFPGAKVDLLDAGHFPFIELPDEVDSLVRPFWAEHVGRPGKR
jgi:pimeloyl-ACP methyl ester carboxylesterase